MLELFEQVTKGTTKYSDEFWNKLKNFVYNVKEKESGDFIISYLFKVNKKNVISVDTKLIIFIIPCLYPFKDNQIDQLTKSIANCVSKLCQVKGIEKASRRGLLLCSLMDMIFHNPEVICDVSEDSKESLFESILEMSKLEYDVNISDGESYFKNYHVIQFISYFDDTEKKNRLINSYLNHFDARIRDDMEFEINEHPTSFEYYENRKE